MLLTKASWSMYTMVSALSCICRTWRSIAAFTWCIDLGRKPRRYTEALISE
jgi:hypothetical protein